MASRTVLLALVALLAFCAQAHDLCGVPRSSARGFVNRASPEGIGRYTGPQRFNFTYSPSFNASYVPAVEHAGKLLSAYLDIPANDPFAVPIRMDQSFFSYSDSFLILSTYEITPMWTDYHSWYLCLNGTYPYDDGDISEVPSIIRYRTGQSCSTYDPNTDGTITMNVPTVATPFVWYLGLDGQAPSGQYDFVTAVLHQLVHVLGFVDMNRKAGQSVVPSQYLTYNRFQYILDMQLKMILVGTVTPYSYNGNNLNLATSNGATFLLFGSDQVTNISFTQSVYTPPEYSTSTSLHHWDEGIPDGPSTPSTVSNKLMTPRQLDSESIHVLGGNTVRVLQFIGWPMRVCSSATDCVSCTALPSCGWCVDTANCGDPTSDSCVNGHTNGWYLNETFCPNYVPPATTTTGDSSTVTGGSNNGAGALAWFLYF